MIHHFHRIVYLLIFCLSFISCKAEDYRTEYEQNSFCYWKASFSFYSGDKELWKESNANHMYVRYFDVGWDVVTREAKPMGTLRAYSTLPTANFTPSVFITNDVFRNAKKSALDTLCIRIKNRIGKVDDDFRARIETKRRYDETMTDTFFRYNEILIDCDWTEGTKKNFFYFIEKLKNMIPEKHITLTLRLWQYKNQKNSGIPPVDRVLLMCYNVESANKYEVDNSIATLDNIKKYVSGVSYPLKVDIALPLFNWGIIFRDKEFKGIIGNVSLKDYMDNPDYEQLGNNRFQLKNEMIIGSFFARPGDEIRVEMLSREELKELAAYLQKEVKQDKYSRITFFSWDSKYINNYDANEIKNIFTRNIY